MKYLLLFVGLVIIACGVVALTEDQPSGAKQGAYAFAAVGVIALGYNKYRTGSWTGDSSGGH